MTAQFLFPSIAILWSIGIVTYCTYTKPYKKYFWPSDDDDDEEEKEKKQRDIRLRLTIMFTLSFLFSLYAFIMSGLAVGFGEHNLSDEIKTWYKKAEGSHQINTLYGIPPLMLAEDIIVLLAFFIAAVVCITIFGKKIHKTGDTDDVTYLSKAWWRFCAYSVIFPTINIAVHANHILIGFVHNQQHALSVALFYVVILITNVHVLRVVVSMLYKNHEKPEENSIKGFLCVYICGFVSCFVVSVFINLTFAFIAAVYVVIPINNAFVEAPARLRQIYDTVILAIAAGFAFWFYKHSREIKK